MILLTSTSDKLQVVTGAAVTVDVHASWVDYTTSAVTPGRTNTAITTAATTDVVAAPAASTYRNIKTLHVRNKHATSSVVVTVRHTDGTTIVELWSATLPAGTELSYVEGVGFVVTTSNAPSGNANTADVTANAADTYLAGSALLIAGAVKAGTILRWRFTCTKTAAGIATPIFTVRTGTAQSTADTARLTFTGVAQTAAVDNGWFDLEIIVRDAGATGGFIGAFKMAHKQATTGFANVAQDQIFSAVVTAIDMTTAGLYIGVSCNPGASGVWTFQTVSALMANAA